MSLLETSELAFFDGTFRMAPTGYCQIMTLIVLNPATNLFTPVVYFFATSKQEDIYSYAFNGLSMLLKKQQIKWNIKIMVVDFELAIHKGIKANYPEIMIVGCFFHLVYNFNYFMRILSFRFDRFGDMQEHKV